MSDIFYGPELPPASFSVKHKSYVPMRLYLEAQTRDLTATLLDKQFQGQGCIPFTDKQALEIRASLESVLAVSAKTRMCFLKTLGKQQEVKPAEPKVNVEVLEKEIKLPEVCELREIGVNDEMLADEQGTVEQEISPGDPSADHTVFQCESLDVTTESLCALERKGIEDEFTGLPDLVSVDEVERCVANASENLRESQLTVEEVNASVDEGLAETIRDCQAGGIVAKLFEEELIIYAEDLHGHGHQCKLGVLWEDLMALKNDLTGCGGLIDKRPDIHDVIRDVMCGESILEHEILQMSLLTHRGLCLDLLELAVELGELERTGGLHEVKNKMPEVKFQGKESERKYHVGVCGARLLDLMGDKRPPLFDEEQPARYQNMVYFFSASERWSLYDYID